MLARLGEPDRRGARRYHPTHGIAPVPAPARSPVSRVIDCSTVLAGPYCTMLLGDLGADVIKVEPPEGDGTRAWGPPWVGSEADGTRTAAYYLAVNRNKRSIRLDLKSAEGAEVLRRLVGRGDVLVENFRTGGFARLGFDDAELERLNPGLVHLAISGYGTDRSGRGSARLRLRHPGVERPHVDHRRAPIADGGGPTKVGVAISDVMTGMLGAVSVLASLVARERAGRSATRPRPADRRLAAGGDAVRPRQPGAERVRHRRRARSDAATQHPNIVPYETFETADGVDRRRGRVGAPVAPAVRRPRAAGARGRSAVRHERRSGRTTRRAAAHPGRALRRAPIGRVAGDPRGRRDPGRPDQRHPRGVRLARGGRARHDGRAWITRPGA